ncbi:MAG: GNAT family N-acetyltransferase [Anaerolineae bacterium]|nr:GNAT family N-acetyltransferase [Anaerolineae bacterium]
MNNEQVVNIRQATEEDVSAIVDILRGLEWLTRFNSETALETERRVGYHFQLCAADDSHSVYVAEKANGTVAGYTAVHWLPYLMLAGPEGYVSELFIRDTERGQGIGTKLLETVKKEARQRGCSRLMLLNIRQRESYQRGFYKKVGWEERPQAANFVLPLT